MLRGEIRLLPQLWGTVRQLLILDGPAHKGKDRIWPVSYVPEMCWLAGIMQHKTLKDHFYIFFWLHSLILCWTEMKLWLRVGTLACFGDWVTLVMICKNPKLIAEGTEVNTKLGMPAGPCLESVEVWFLLMMIHWFGVSVKKNILMHRQVALASSVAALKLYSHLNIFTVDIHLIPHPTAHTMTWHWLWANWLFHFLTTSATHRFLGSSG